MSEVERVEREQRLAEIRGRYPVLRLSLPGPWYSDHVGYLLAEVDRLTAELDALRADAALGALVRRLPEMLRRKYAPDWGEPGEQFEPDWASLTVDETGYPSHLGWTALVGEEEVLAWADVGHETPEAALEHALAVASTKEATDD